MQSQHYSKCMDKEHIEPLTLKCQKYSAVFPLTESQGELTIGGFAEVKGLDSPKMLVLDLHPLTANCGWFDTHNNWQTMAWLRQYIEPYKSPYYRVLEDSDGTSLIDKITEAVSERLTRTLVKALDESEEQ